MTVQTLSLICQYWLRPFDKKVHFEMEPWCDLKDEWCDLIYKKTKQQQTTTTTKRQPLIHCINMLHTKLQMYMSYGLQNWILCISVSKEAFA